MAMTMIKIPFISFSPKPNNFDFRKNIVRRAIDAQVVLRINFGYLCNKCIVSLYICKAKPNGNGGEKEEKRLMGNEWHTNWIWKESFWTNPSFKDGETREEEERKQWKFAVK
jgi:hypothetical protein